MNKKPWLKKVVTGALLGGLLLGSAGYVWAADSSSVSNTIDNVKTKFQSMMPGGRGHGHGMMGGEMGMNLNLQTLVGEGVISSDESTAIQAKIDALQAERQAEMDKIKAMTAEERQAYFEARKTAADDLEAVKKDLLTMLVDEKIISSDTADAIRNNQQAQRQEEMQRRTTDQLSALVADGTITSAQSDAILAAIQAEQAERQSEMEKVKAMTAEERQAYFQANQPTRGNDLAVLVSAGALTQEQADAVQKALGGPRGGGQGHGGKGPGGMGFPQ
ncbi:MAG TPA: hypothetical protein PLC88_00690 [Syntrophomonas sp.]|nr:hypothetical protein [Syntrophomonas sp.]HRW12560.1 hypothetical protein [Syntrophomonas sp.]